MANTEAPGAGPHRPGSVGETQSSAQPGRPATVSAVDAHDIDDLLALSQAAGWNQNTDDWLWMLGAGRARGIRLDGHVVASTLVLPWPTSTLVEAPSRGELGAAVADQAGAASAGERGGVTSPHSVAWVSMVLVLPEYRRLGYARELLRDALAWLSEPAQQHLLPVLDATPAGHEVYLQEGFSDTWGFTRWQREALSTEPGGVNTQAAGLSPSISVRSLASIGRADDADSPEAFMSELRRLDSKAFGADRSQLIAALIQRAPQSAWFATTVVAGEPRVTGYVLTRPGRNAIQVGPLVAADSTSARALLAQVLASMDTRLFIDIPDEQLAFRDLVTASGFTPQRPFTRMVFRSKGNRQIEQQAPGDPSVIWAVAGPELG